MCSRASAARCELRHAADAAVSGGFRFNTEMSLADRDWYRDELNRREARAFRPPRDTALLSAVVVAIVLASALFWAVRGFMPSKGAASQKMTWSTRAPIPAPAPLQPQAPETSSHNSPSIPNPTYVYRCRSAGHTRYDDRGQCEGQMAAAAVAAPAERPGEPPGPTEYQREMLRSADARIARNEAAMREQLAYAQVARSRTSSECAGLAAQIRSIDARARQPQPAWEQDRLKAHRQVLTSRQFELRC